MVSSSSLARRAALALLMLAGFYVLAVTIAAALLWIPYAEWTYLHRVDGRVALGCLISAAAILWSFRPRRAPWTPPGPALQPSEQPELFSLIQDVAARTHQDVPEDVYLVPDVNAFVSQRANVSGVGGRRIMGLGFPLLQILTVSELKAVLAHEFGHYHGGDVALGPVVYRTHRSIGQTLAAVSGSLVEVPFAMYGKLFMRVSSSVSRHQEFVADGLAGRTVGAAPLVSGLKKVAGQAPLYAWFLQQEVAPALRAGCVPPFTSGYLGYVARPDMQRAIDELIQESMSGNALAGTYDTHPPLSARVAALEQLPSTTEPIDSRPALSLLRHADEFDLALAHHLLASDSPRKSIGWDDVVPLVHLPEWQRLLRARQRYLGVLRFENVPAGPEESARVAREIRETLDSGDDNLELAKRFAYIVSIAACAKLHAAGWTFRTAPGLPITMSRGTKDCDPFAEVHALMLGNGSRDNWIAFCNEVVLAGPLA